MDIGELKDMVVNFRNEREWSQYHNPKDLAISISLEAAELLEIFQWKDFKEVEAVNTNEQERRKVKEELGDILIYALTLTEEFGFDPSDVVLDKMQINDKRYPVEKCKGKSHKYTIY